MIDFQRLLQDYHITYWTEGNNVTAGWVNIQCPMCDDHSNHGGFSPEKEFYNCWRCGWHPVEDVIEKIIPVKNPWAILKEYRGLIQQRINVKKGRGSGVNELVFPPGTGPMEYLHKRYLYDRGFDPDYLEKKYHLKGTNHRGPYKFRIIIPIYFDGKLVSYQGRDITGRSSLRYKTCAPENEVIHHKTILYGMDDIPDDTAIVVEGVLDAWKLGPGAICPFGTTVTMQQINLLSKRLKRAFILFDSEPKAQESAHHLALSLEGVGLEVEQLTLTTKGDPGDLSIQEAQKLMKEVLKNEG